MLKWVLFLVSPIIFAGAALPCSGLVGVYTLNQAKPGTCPPGLNIRDDGQRLKVYEMRNSQQLFLFGFEHQNATTYLNFLSKPVPTKDRASTGEFITYNGCEASQKCVAYPSKGDFEIFPKTISYYYLKLDAHEQLTMKNEQILSKMQCQYKKDR